MTRKIVAWFTALFLILAPIPFASLRTLEAQSAPAAQALNASDSGNCTTANACLVLTLGSQDRTAVVQLSGTFSATAQFEASGNGGASWASIAGPTFALGAAASSATAAGAWTFDVAGRTSVRVRLSAYTSGTVNATITSSQAQLSTQNLTLPQTLTTAATPTFAGVNQTTGGQFQGITARVYAATDTTTSGVGTNLEPITNLTWTLPANTAATYAFHCYGTYTQNVAAAAVSFGVTLSVAPTTSSFMGFIGTAATTMAQGMTSIITATSANVVTGTPGAAGTTNTWSMDGTIENPSTTANVVLIDVKTATAADTVTVKRGSYCVLEY